jgi:DNA modification methylase
MPDIKVYHADSRDVLLTLEPASIDAVVCDPPYALVSILKRFGKPGSAPAQEGTDGRFKRASVGFMGQEWDTGETAHDPDFWRLVAQAMKPGSHLVAFAGTRTYHQIATAIEDAGFEIRDMIAWLYGTGFPKSHDMQKAIEDMAFAAWLELNIDRKLAMIGEIGICLGDAKLESEVEQKFRAEGAPYLDAIKWEGWGTALKPALEPIVLARLPISEPTIARNVLEYGTGALNIDACRIDGKKTRAPVGQYGGSSVGPTGHTGMRKSNPLADIAGRWPANVAHDDSDETLAGFPDSDGQLRNLTGNETRTNNVFGAFPSSPSKLQKRGDSGSAARFFFSAKADKIDRWGSKHPTVKPINLMRWLVRMVTPPGGTVLDPFAGSGTTGVAALAEGMNAVLIEQNADYAADIEARLAHYRGDGAHSLVTRARHKAEKAGSLL